MKIAIFLSGPVRYVELVYKQLSTILRNMEHDFFIHLWHDDNTKKRRETVSSEWQELGLMSDVKSFVLHRPYEEVVYMDQIGTNTHSNSPIHATMGMFLAINQLCHILEMLPDKTNYTHVMRVRTDCIFFNDHFLNLLFLSPESILVADNPRIPKSYISDHLMLAPRKDFMKLWRFEDMKEIYRWYRIGRRNPEKLLAIRMRAKFPLLMTKKVTLAWRRYVDYHIVYSPCNMNDPLMILQYFEHRNVGDLFADAMSMLIDDDHYLATAVIRPKDPWAYSWNNLAGFIMKWIWMWRPWNRFLKFLKVR